MPNNSCIACSKTATHHLKDWFYVCSQHYQKAQRLLALPHFKDMKSKNELF